MPLKLVIGPANAEKAGAAMDAYRRALAAGRDPLLIVPTFADVDVYRRELAASGAVFGVQVVQFQRLMREIARRTKSDGRPIGGLARERVAAVATARTKLETLAASAATPGFARSLLGLISELEELRLDPGRVIQALRAWTADDPSRRPYAEELGALYAAYHRELERAQALDYRLQDVAALDALRLDPAAWGRTPVVIYGFDDLSPLQRDAVETLACHAEAEVTLTLTYEPGRTALAARARTYEDLRALPGAEVLELRAVAEHYASPALHHLERTLFEPGEGLALFDAASVPAGEAVRMLEGGGERAEVELVAAEVAALVRSGYEPEEIAVVWRASENVPVAVEEIFEAYGVPVALTRRLRARDTALGRGVIALLRCALLDGTADDLLTWLRTPGVLDTPGLADRLEADVRRNGIPTAAKARGLWEERHWPLQAIDYVTDARGKGPAALCEQLAREVNRLVSRPHYREAPILGGPERVDANAAAALRSALRELSRLARRDPELVPGPQELERVLGELPVFAGRQAGPGLVQVTNAEAIRARRVRALFLCGLNEQVFPAPARPDPLLSDEDRIAINQAAGLRLTVGIDQLALERYLLYAAVSRPTDLLVLSWHAASDDGDPVVRSLFVDDIADRFSDAPLERLRRRPLGAAGWPDGEAPTAREAALGAAANAPPAAPQPLGPVSPEVMAQAVPADRPLSATAIEAFNDCPIKWFVDRLLNPKDLVPDPEAMVRGSVAHEVLAAVFSEHGGRPLQPGDLPAARERMHEALAAGVASRPISVNPERLRAAVRRLESDLVRYLEYAALDGSELGPVDFEREFTVDLGPFELHGFIDRIDAGGGEAVIVDYKGKTATEQAKWIKDGKLQLGLYVLAARRLAEQGEFPGEPVGGLYQPLGNTKEGRPRGALLAGADPGRTVVSTDRLSPEEFDDLLGQVLAAAEEAVAQLRAGALEPRPKSCAYGGGCQYPTICRCDAA
ncbi:MAG: PD-(D/E)XK nuclease family protein [Solirubrobacteraceae bacterium]